MALLLGILLALTSLSSVTAIPLDDFYPFGLAAGDTALPRTDDESSDPITLNREFPFYGRRQDVVVVNNNGLISFRHSVSAFTPVPFPLVSSSEIDVTTATAQLIAPFWGDVDTRGTGTVWHRESTDQADRDRAQREIRRAFPAQAARFTSRLVFIATWDHVGYYNSQMDLTNTFQCILASDGFMSYVIFLYADGLIQWTTGSASGGIGGLEGTPAQVGFNAGDMMNFASHVDSQTAAIVDIESSSIPEGRSEAGMLVYRVDGSEINPAGCVDSADAVLTFTPPVVNQLGGTPILISGFCVQPDDFIVCAFDKTSAPRAERIDDSTFMCVTPLMTSLGEVEVEVTKFFPQPSIEISVDNFITMSPVRGHQVGFSVTSSSDEMQLYFKANDIISLTWMPREVVPSYLTDDFENLMMTIELYQQIPFAIIGRADWLLLTGSRVDGVPNTGTAQYTIPAGLPLQDCGSGNRLLCPVVFRLSATVPTPSGRNAELAIWSAVGYLQSDDATANMLVELCNDWFMPQPPAMRSPNEIPDSILNDLLECPPTQAQATADSRFRVETMQSALSDHSSGYPQAAMKFYYPAASVCFVEIIMEGSTRSEGHQCCYDNNGDLVTGQPGGGNADKTSPLVSFNKHNMDDLLPYAFCCRTNLTMVPCDRYDDLRPSVLANAEPYELPVPACVFGDPHIVTLDGHKYTFNGKGEFTLVETHDDSFTLQGRMEQAVGGTSRGTVFTSIVAHQEGAVDRTVEFQVSRQGDLDVLVDGVRVNFADSSEQNFRQVVVTDRGNNTAIAEFSGGSNIEIRVENDIISVMLVTLPNRYRGLTSGLMGNFNRETRDDFIPKDSSISIPLDSSVEEIFAYGKTWMLTDSSESLFAYNNPGESFENFMDMGFEPVFAPEFEDEELERRAGEICGDDQFCLFDIAATGTLDIGMATMSGVRDFDMIVDLAEPIVCVPPCENGVCVATNSCSCSVGFSGQRCTERIESECETNICQNNGTCVQRVRSFTCNCPDGFIGIFCQEREPPFSLLLLNSSPRIDGTSISVDFQPSKPVSFARCSLLPSGIQVDCSSGRVQFSDVSPGSHRVVIRARTVAGDRAVERRNIFICDDGSCGVNPINEGVTVTGDCVNIQFTSCGEVDSFQCKLNRGDFTPCRSPVQYCGLEVMSHRVQVVPEGAECSREMGRLSVNFNVI